MIKANLGHQLFKHRETEQVIHLPIVGFTNNRVPIYDFLGHFISPSGIWDAGWELIAESSYLGAIDNPTIVSSDEDIKITPVPEEATKELRSRLANRAS